MEADTMNFKPKSLVFWSPSGWTGHQSESLKK